MKDELYQEACNVAVERTNPLGALRLIDRFLNETDPNDIDFLLLKGKVLDQLAEYELSARMYRKVLRLDPQNPRALIDMGDCWSIYRENHATGIRYYDRALRAIDAGHVYQSAASEYVDACVGRVDALIERGRAAEARAAAQAGLARYPGDAALLAALERAERVAGACR